MSWMKACIGPSSRASELSVQCATGARVLHNVMNALP